MKRLISFLLCIVMITILTVCAESSDSDDAMVFSQAIARLKRVNSRASVEDARNMLNNIASNYQQANMFSLYASAILDIYDDDFDRARIRIELLEKRVDFAELLENYELPSCEILKRYIEARCAEKEGRYDTAIDIYISINFLDSMERSFELTYLARSREYEYALELFNAGKYYEAALAFMALDGYKDSAQMYDKALKLHTHSWTPATCISPQTCVVCGEISGQALGHSYKAATCTEPKTCTRCGATEGKALGHNWKSATCTAPRTCTRCGKTEGSKLSHSYKAATCTEPKTCTRCGVTEGKALGHNWKNATCTAPKTCTRCGKTEGKALGHNWLPASIHLPETCSRCGITRGDKLQNEWLRYRIAAGAYHSIALKSDGTVLAEGDNQKGQCNVSPWRNVVSVAASDYHTLGLKKDGTVYATGDNSYGQCNVSSWKDIVEICANAVASFGLKADGKVVSTWRLDNYELSKDLGDVKAIAAMEGALICLRADGTVDVIVLWGSGISKQIMEQLKSWTNILAISAAGSHAMGLKENGSVVAAYDDDDNYFNQNNVNDWKNIVSVKTANWLTFGLKSDGTVVLTGWESNESLSKVNRWKNIVEIAVGFNHCVGIKTDGTVVTIVNTNFSSSNSEGVYKYGDSHVSTWKLN